MGPEPEWKNVTEVRCFNASQYAESKGIKIRVDRSIWKCTIITREGVKERKHDIIAKKFNMFASETSQVFEKSKQLNLVWAFHEATCRLAQDILMCIESKEDTYTREKEEDLKYRWN